MFQNDLKRLVGRTKIYLAFAIGLLLVVGSQIFLNGEVEAKQTKLRLGHVYSAGSQQDQIAHRFAKLVDEKSNGSAKIDIFPGGELGSWREIIEQVKGGITHIVMEAVPTLETYDPVAGTNVLPFLFDSPSHYTKIWQEPVGSEYLEEVTRKTGFKIIGPYYVGFRHMTVNKPVHTAADLEGLKLRTPPAPVYTDPWKILGANPVPMNFVEVFLAIQQGVVDGQENPLVYAYSERFYQVAKYIVLTGHAIEDTCFILSNKVFESLAPDVQEALVEAGKELGPWATNLAVSKEDEYLEIFKEAGNIIIWPNRASFRKKLEGYVKKSYPACAPWYEKFQAVK